MQRTETECLDALREAARRLGESPTKAAYEELGLTPSSSTIIRIVGGWNEAKERAGLETNPSSGSRVGPKPADVELPAGLKWEELSVDQRWHYRNVEWNAERTLKRRSRLRAWANEQKGSTGCRECGITDPAVLDFHHRDPSEKTMAIGEMITHGYSVDKLETEIAKCDVLCANCHSKEHHDGTDGSAIRAWLGEVKQAVGGCHRCPVNDPRCLVFHHASGDKRDTIANMVSDRYPKPEIRAEIDKCVLLCANCHRREHFEPPQQER
jgi:5-methylcytosine-specific restriction endonuclease McrA